MAFRNGGQRFDVAITDLAMGQAGRAFLQKPFAAEELVGHLQELLRPAP